MSDNAHISEEPLKHDIIDPRMLTEDQRRYICAAATTGVAVVATYRLTAADGDKVDDWVIVEDFDNLGTEGSGVWLDPKGLVHYGPGETGHDQYGIHA